MAKNFIKSAIKRPGQLHRDLGVKQGEKIPKSKLEAAAKKGGKVGERARFAETLEKLRPKGSEMKKHEGKKHERKEHEGKRHEKKAEKSEKREHYTRRHHEPRADHPTANQHFDAMHGAFKRASGKMED
jgi:hypothetical protein